MVVSTQVDKVAGTGHEKDAKTEEWKVLAKSLVMAAKLVLQLALANAHKLESAWEEAKEERLEEMLDSARAQENVETRAKADTHLIKKGA